MKKNFAPTIISCIAIMVIAVTLFVNKVTYDKPMSAEELKDLGMYSINPPRELGDFELIDSSNSRFLPSDFRGNWNFLFFGFSFCPDICPITMKLLSNIENELESEIKNNLKIYMVSVDPDRDSPEKLRTYLDNFSKDFEGLTGGLDQIYLFATRVNAPFSPQSNNPDPYYTVDHTGSIVVINPEGKYAGFFRAPHDQEKIKTAIKDILLR
ncbi:MAG: SCO family protein [Gammaproteobacteria bacterium]